MTNILIVDDDPILRTLLLQILEPFEEWGVKPITAENGDIAIEKIRSEKPKIVILDVMMPQVDGFEVCSIVKRNPEMKGTYIIMLTAKGQKTDLQKAKHLGADYYITKPFSPDELARKISEILVIPNR